MNLSGPDQASLSGALMAAFPTRGELAVMTQHRLEMNLNVIVSEEKNLAETTFQLVSWCYRHGVIPNLLKGALEERPNFEALEAFSAKFVLDPSLSLADLLELLRQLDNQLTPFDWLREHALPEWDDLDEAAGRSVSALTVHLYEHPPDGPTNARMIRVLTFVHWIRNRVASTDIDLYRRLTAWIKNNAGKIASSIDLTVDPASVTNWKKTAKLRQIFLVAAVVLAFGVCACFFFMVSGYKQRVKILEWEISRRAEWGEARDVAITDLASVLESKTENSGITLNSVVAFTGVVDADVQLPGQRHLEVCAPNNPATAIRVPWGKNQLRNDVPVLKGYKVRVVGQIVEIEGKRNWLIKDILIAVECKK